MASWTRSTEMIGRAITRGHKQLGLGETMSKGGIFDLASGVGGKIDKADVLSSVDEYEKYHGYYGGKEEDRKKNYSDMVNKYYDLATSFYEYGWGECFHFAPIWKGESLQESLKRHQHFIALQLNLKPGQTVLDVGCGIGGPLREIARFSRTKVTGLNNNEYQITRGKVLNRAAGLEQTCDFVKADFMKMPFPDNSFDAAFAIQATCHAPDIVGCYKEIYRVLKPGQCFVSDEWCLTDSYNPDSSEHQKIKSELELGNSLPEIRLTSQCLEAAKKAGFEVVWEKDLAEDSPIPWYSSIDTSFSLSISFRLTAVGQFVLQNMVQALESVGIAPKGSRRVYDFLQKSRGALVAGANYTPGAKSNSYHGLGKRSVAKNMVGKAGLQQSESKGDNIFKPTIDRFSFDLLDYLSFSFDLMGLLNRVTSSISHLNQARLSLSFALTQSEHHSPSAKNLTNSAREFP
nr:cycloartenol-C-24-methyltransferase 1-like [Ipomoea trifida]